ncbi:MAG: hypothetical protein K9W44_17205 [Candidatus Lokiarchaeota archaeon]|nr:hypothetical protein [Candidatus Harpocratesius repetitus]
MAQINFRIDKEIKEIVDIISKNLGISAAELAKQATLKEISRLRVNLAFNLLKAGKIGRKRAWTISGLSTLEFLNEWTKRGVEEVISDETRESSKNLIENFDLSSFRRKNR